MHKEILVIDDNPDIRFLICNILKEQNFNVRSATNYDQAVIEINKKLPDLALVDIKLDREDKDGIDLLKLIMSKNKSTPVIVISGHATVQVAVEAIRLGAYEFIEKPFSTEKILNYVNRGLETATLKQEKNIIENKLFHSFELIGKSPSIIKVKKIIEKLSNTESRVLITGPTGSGKELVARKIHKLSLRDKKPFVVINGDDYYGKESFKVISDYYFRGKEQFCMVGFRLKNTLSSFGAVTRGVCSVENKKLSSVVETGDLRKKGNIIYSDRDISFDGNEPVSMSMWGFTPVLFHHLKEKFIDFLNVHGREVKSEFLIPSIINELIQDGDEKVHVLETNSSWFGVTYKSDKPIVEKKIQQLVSSGVYPSPLF